MGPAKVGCPSQTTWSQASPASSRAGPNPPEQVWALRAARGFPQAGNWQPAGAAPSQAASGGTPSLLHPTPEGSWASGVLRDESLAGSSAGD